MIPLERYIPITGIHPFTRQYTEADGSIERYEDRFIAQFEQSDQLKDAKIVL